MYFYTYEILVFGAPNVKVYGYFSNIYRIFGCGIIAFGNALVPQQKVI